MTATADDGDDMARRRKKKDPVPVLPRRFEVRVGNRAVAEIAFGDDPGQIVPGSLAWLQKPENVCGIDREKSVGRLIKDAGLDPKTDHMRLYDAVWGPPTPPYKSLEPTE